MHYNQIKAPTFVGLRNWRYVLEQMPLFGPALWNTLWLVVVMVALRVVFGLGIGLLITKVKAGVGLFRTAFYIPYLAPPVAATVAFVFLLNPSTGPVNEVLSWIGLHGPNWFNDPNWSKPSLVLLSLWGIGDLMVIFMASLLDVPKEQYEAADLDGAGAGLSSVTSPGPPSSRSCSSPSSPEWYRRCSTTRRPSSRGSSPRASPSAPAR